MQNHPFRKEMPKLNGAFILITEDNEFRMSHWVTGFEIKDPATGQPVLLLDCSFHLEKYEEQDNLLQFHFKVYPHGSVSYVA